MKYIYQYYKIYVVCRKYLNTVQIIIFIKNGFKYKSWIVMLKNNGIFFLKSLIYLYFQYPFTHLHILGGYFFLRNV